jgi:Family of unknown function (DUF6328)
MSLRDNHGGDDRPETPAERADRNFLELLNELRVLQTGVQILFGFLLILAVQPRFANASDFERLVYLITLMLSCGATALLMAPAAYHRMLFAQGRKAEVVTASNRLANAGICVLLLAMSSATLLVVELVFSQALAWMLSICVAVTFAAVWIGLPLSRRAGTSDAPDRATRHHPDPV